MHLFYVRDIHKDSAFLSKEESQHCIKVLRLKKHDQILLSDGKGNSHKAEITEADAKQCGIRIISSEKISPPSWHIHMAVSPVKNNERNEWFLEKAVELGIQEVTFVLCERSERKTINLERLEKISMEAAKQSLKFHLPKINVLTPFKELLKQPREGQKFIAHLEEANKKHLMQSAGKNSAYTVLIGPEGDFSPAEIALAVTQGYTPVTLGESRLRTETAAIAACHMLNLINTADN